MSRLLLGTICGPVYGALSAASMIPLTFADKTAALTGALLNRFAIGFVMGGARAPRLSLTTRFHHFYRVRVEAPRGCAALRVLARARASSEKLADSSLVW